MSNSTITPGSIVLEPRVIERIHQVHQYLDRMRQERVGWGPIPQADVSNTAVSFVTSLDLLFSAREVWIDGGAGYSFGGVLSGGIVFGMIAREETPARLEVDGEVVRFAHPPLRWTFHS